MKYDLAPENFIRHYIEPNRKRFSDRLSQDYGITKEDAEEIINTAANITVAHWQSCRETPRAYFWSVVRRQALARISRAAREIEKLRDFHQSLRSERQNEAATLRTESLLDRITEYVTEHETPYVQDIFFKFLNGQSWNDIGMDLEKSTSAVRRRFYDLIQHLRQRFM